MKYLIEELGIPKKYIEATDKEGLFIALVHKEWLSTILKMKKLIEFIDGDNLESWTVSDENNSSWNRIFINSFKKLDAKVIPLPRMRKVKDDPPLLFSQLKHYICQTIYKSLWKDRYKKYHSEMEFPKETPINLVDYKDVLKEIIFRAYGCPIINICEPALENKVAEDFDRNNLNIFPAVCAIETLNNVFVIHSSYLTHNLKDCVTFSPAILDKYFTKPLFIVYQLVLLLKYLHNCSLTLGEITLSDIYVTEDLWLNVFPLIKSNIYIQELNNSKYRSSYNKLDCKTTGIGHKPGTQMICELCGVKIYDKVQIKNENFEKICQLWIDGEISNFTYITVLNSLSGRRFGDPNCHYVFPWVTDFTSRCGKNWRDLRKSKYRINKGDRQLDLTYESSQSQVPHHVSDVLSSITYYVYMARRTPKAILCKNVRSVWVPAEYPSSIQRMQEWTPDECIPELFTDPSVFRSIHEDLEDLEFPSWCSSPEEFIELHREALESSHASERLHHWIDLTFGYRLSGTAAVKSKNVCLSLVDSHEELTKSGIVQLFTYPHPPKKSPSLFFGKTPPSLFMSKTINHHKQEVHSDMKSDVDNADEICNPQTQSASGNRLLISEEQIYKSKNMENQKNLVLGQKPLNVPVKQKSTWNSNGTIFLPKDYKPEQSLDQLEKKHLFLSKTFHTESRKVFQDTEQRIITESDCSNNAGIQNAFTNFMYTEEFEESLGKVEPFHHKHVASPKHKKNVTALKTDDRVVIYNYSEIISMRRIRELQVLGCLVVEIFMAKQLRALGITDKMKFADRLKTCVAILKDCRNEVPPSILYITEILLHPSSASFEQFKYPVVTEFGLPSPTAHLLLEPLLHFFVPFPIYSFKLYSLICNIKKFKNVITETELSYYFHCKGNTCSEYECSEQKKQRIIQNIGECLVKDCVKNLEKLANTLNMNKDQDFVCILLPHVKQLIEDPPTAVLAAWYLFDPMSRLLGPEKTSKTLLPPLLKLYENEPNDSVLPYYEKIAKLYHHSFLLRLIIRLGLKCFLDNFTVPLVEAVGCYRDYDKNDLILHTHTEKIIKKNSHLRTMQMDEETSTAAKPASLRCRQKSINEPDIFDFEDEKQNVDQQKSLIMDHLELNDASDPSFLNSSTEEALDATITENLDQLKSLEELNISFGEEESYSKIIVCSPAVSAESPPSKYNEYYNISCEGDSKESGTISCGKSNEISESDSATDLCCSDSEKQRSSPVTSSIKSGPKIKERDSKISDVSCDSLIWLSHRLGPVLTAKFLSRNLLKMLTLCYVGRENLTPIERDNNTTTDSSTNRYAVVGDQIASKVLECLTSIAGLYGEPYVLFQYIPHMSELVTLCKRKLTPNLEGGLISCLSLLQHVVPYLSDATLMDQLQDVILKDILHPIVQLLASVEHTFPNGYAARNTLARKYIDTLYCLSIRIGADMTRTHLAVPALKNFFLIFEKIYKTRTSFHTTCDIENAPQSETELNYLQSTPKLTNEELLCRTNNELLLVFTPQLAYKAYLPFLQHIGEESLQITLENHRTIRELCQLYEKSLKNDQSNISNLRMSDFIPTGNTMTLSNSIGSNIAVIGNRIDIHSVITKDVGGDILNNIGGRIESNTRHLRGNWLAYWEHEIGRSDKDNMFNFKQINLQTFVGHTHSVKCLQVLDNENSFMSGSRDKTVKLWSLRNHGDGSNTNTCQWTYTAHKKTVLSLTFVESMRLVASSDSVVHIWDPFMGVNLGCLESPRMAPVNVLKSMPPPSSLVVVATTEGTIKITDTKLCSYVQELKMSINTMGLIRCIAISPSGLWIAAGQSAGSITVLDTRTGLVLTTWKAHEGEVLQLIALNNDTLISTSLDQNISVWDVKEGKFKFGLRGPTEPVHCLNIYNNELISGSTANRIGVHTSIDLEASFSSIKLRTDTFKGLLTSMTMLPLNKLLLLGADTGNINLLC